MQLKWTDLASKDLENIEAYIASESSSLNAIDVVLSIIESIELILPDHPSAGRHGRVKSTRELVVGSVPFIVIYREQVRTNCLEIVRVLHQAQQWPPD